MISLSYSRISLADIAQKLQLDSPEDAEFIVAKVGQVQGLAVGGDWLRRGMGKALAQSAGSASLAVKPGSCQRVCYMSECVRV